MLHRGVDLEIPFRRPRYRLEAMLEYRWLWFGGHYTKMLVIGIKLTEAPRKYIHVWLGHRAGVRPLDNDKPSLLPVREFRLRPNPWKVLKKLSAVPFCKCHSGKGLIR